MGSVVEQSPTFVAILAALEAGGARSREGFAISQPDLADAVGVTATTIGRYMKKMVELGVLKRRASTTGPGFGHPRAPDRYWLNCSVEQWVETVGPKAVERAQKRQGAKIKVHAQNREREKRRRSKPRGSAAVAKSKPRPAPVALDDGEVGALAAELEREGDLFGW